MNRTMTVATGLILGTTLLSAGAFAAPAVLTPMTGSAGGALQESPATKEAVVTNTTEPRVFPNPWRSDRTPNASITFDHLPPESTVKIFTLSGHEIKTLDAANGTVAWDRTNEGGENVASGIYLYLVSDILGDEFHGKLAIIK